MNHWRKMQIHTTNNFYFRTMKNTSLGLLLIVLLAFGTACDRWIPGDPIACMSLEDGTAIRLGETLRVVSCAQNAETIIWRVDSQEKARGENMEIRFDQVGEYEVEQEVIGFKDEVLDKVSSIVAVGHPSIAKMTLLDIEGSLYEDSVGAFRLTLYATNYQNFWEKELLGTYEGQDSMPIVWEVKNPRQFNLRDSTWQLHAEWFWKENQIPTIFDVVFDAAKQSDRGFYIVSIPTMGTLRFDTEITAPL